MKIIIVILSLFLLNNICYASYEKPKIQKKLAIEAIVGEAAGCYYVEMFAIAVAIRNRGTLKGVYGLNNKKMIKKQPEWVFLLAEQAWKRSKNNKIHIGTHWESKKFKTPYWAKTMRKVHETEKHIFYR